MQLSDLIAIVLGLSLTAYAIWAGADFGAGVLDLTAGTNPETRTALARAFGPLWEANHVWLIFSITILFSAFPTAFAALGTATLVPLTLAVMAIVVRGAALGLRTDPGGGERSDRRLGGAYGAASLVAPLLLGATAGALAQVSSSPRAAGAVAALPWTGLFAVSVGLLAVALCTQLAASFITLRLQRAGETGTAEGFRRRGLQAGTSVLALAAITLLIGAWRAPALWHRLSTTALPLLVIGLLAIVTSLQAISRRRYLLARAATALAVTSIVWGWMIAQAPRLIGARLTIHAAAATPAALDALAIAGAAVLVAVLPAFCLLYVVSARHSPEVIE
jgi:cytochrome d ubiquinol oxidase subunit II